jgi:hypothetical protein
VVRSFLLLVFRFTFANKIEVEMPDEVRGVIWGARQTDEVKVLQRGIIADKYNAAAMLSHRVIPPRQA